MRRRFLFEKNLTEKDKQNLEQLKTLSKGIKKDHNEPKVIEIPENAKIAEVKNMPKNVLAQVKQTNEKVANVLNIKKPLNLTKADTKDFSNPSIPVEVAKAAARYNIDIKGKSLKDVYIELAKIKL